ncbi:hypothetical protein [Streptomyces violascens]|uniref:Secreted protein n=1 Tax=Streptomyces violascens TaxID=67381 RepID=A0ABQ3QL36_9ACTN|nr:hypothetical protein [Streptomyces violascens]GGU44450.1 hypothetical protein GCM10010289_76280 [Streptomyces violascens]GHI37999.1 hypothetical protein Sviol_24070 [Streptomyces violascens]
MRGGAHAKPQREAGLGPLLVLAVLGALPPALILAPRAVSAAPWVPVGVARPEIAPAETEAAAGSARPAEQTTP